MNNRLFHVIGVVVLFTTLSVSAEMCRFVGASGGLTYFTQQFKGDSVGENPEFNSSYKYNLVFGGYFSDYIGIETKLGYSNRGFKTTASDSLGTEGSFAAKLGYLTIPIHLKGMYPVTPLFTVFGLAGPNLGFLLNTTGTITIGDLSGKVSGLGELYQTIDFGIDLGAGAEANLGKIVPFVELVYYLGLTNAMNEAPDNTSIKNNGIEINAGVKFKL